MLILELFLCRYMRERNVSPLHLQKRVQWVHFPKTSCTKDHPRQLCQRSYFQHSEMTRLISKYQVCCVLYSAWLLDPING